MRFLDKETIFGIWIRMTKNRGAIPIDHDLALTSYWKSKKIPTLLIIQFSLGAVVMPLNKVENVAIFSEDFQNLCHWGRKENNIKVHLHFLVTSLPFMILNKINKFWFKYFVFLILGAGLYRKLPTYEIVFFLIRNSDPIIKLAIRHSHQFFLKQLKHHLSK